MMRSIRLCAILLILAALPARAAPALDMATFTCDDWLDATEDDQDMMLVWLRGYLAGRSGASLYNADALRADRAAMMGFCRAHGSMGLVSAISQINH